MDLTVRIVFTLHVQSSYRIVQCFKKSSPPTKNGIFSLRLSFFCVKFCKFIGNSCRFILTFHHMGLIFPRVPIVFTVSIFEYSGYQALELCQ